MFEKKKLQHAFVFHSLFSNVYNTNTREKILAREQTHVVITRAQNFMHLHIS